MSSAAAENTQRTKVLLAEDNGFYRKRMYQKSLQTPAMMSQRLLIDGQKALECIESLPDGHFAVVVSDIEMPNMDGFTLCETLNSIDRFKKIPKVAPNNPN